MAAVFLLEDGRVAVKAHGFMPENGAQRHEQSDRVPYLSWAKAGYCTLTPGDVTDNGYVDNWISQGEADHDWEVLEVDYDGHNATDLAIRLCEERNNEDFCVEISQTCAGQNLAVKTFRELLLQGLLVLEESPLLLWCLANAIEVQNNYGDIKLSKKHKDDTERFNGTSMTCPLLWPAVHLPFDSAFSRVVTVPTPMRFLPFLVCLGPGFVRHPGEGRRGQKGSL